MGLGPRMVSEYRATREEGVFRGSSWCGGRQSGSRGVCCLLERACHLPRSELGRVGGREGRKKVHSDDA